MIGHHSKSFPYYVDGVVIHNLHQCLELHFRGTSSFQQPTILCRSTPQGILFLHVLDKTAPIPSMKASPWSTSLSSGLGNVSVCLAQRKLTRWLNASVRHVFHCMKQRAPFLEYQIWGPAHLAKSGMNFL